MIVLNRWSAGRAMRRQLVCACVAIGIVCGIAIPVATSVAAGAANRQERRTDRSSKDLSQWERMDYGPFLCATIQGQLTKDNWCNKGMAIHLGDADHPAAVLFDTATLRYACGWTGEFLKLDGVAFTGAHGPNPSVKGAVVFATTNNPGWAKGGSDWTDPRQLSECFEFPDEKAKREAAGQPPKPGEKVGSMPRDWAHYKAVYLNGDKTILSYSIGDADVLDLPQAKTAGGTTIFSRTLNVGPSKQPMAMVVAEMPENPVQVAADGKSATLKDSPKVGQSTIVMLDGDAPAKLTGEKGRVILAIAPHNGPVKLRVAIGAGDKADVALVKPGGEITDMSALTKGGPARWGDPITTTIHKGDDAAYIARRVKDIADSAQREIASAQQNLDKAQTPDDKRKARERMKQATRDAEKKKLEAEGLKSPGAYVVDVVDVPFDNPYHSWMRTSALDFFSDGRCAISTWNGDVWIVSFDAQMTQAKWKRFATGLFQPLGLRIVNDTLYVQGRDQITILRDLNGDGEADFYENFNNDVQVTSSFHEFSHDLQVDPEGNFYFAKCGPVRPGGKGWQQISRDNGCVIRISKDGKRCEPFAAGLRAPNGMGAGPNGEITVADNEGTWTPTDRLNLVHKGDFLGVVDLCHSEDKPTSYGNPICWLPHNGNPDYGVIDNSNGAQCWVTDDRFGPFKGTMLYLSYGTCSMFHISYEQVGDKVQGGAVKFPLGFDSGSMRLRINPKDGQPWITGLKGWQTAANLDGMLARVRYTGKPVVMPLEWHVKKGGIAITFTNPLDKTSAADAQNWYVEQWNYHWTQDYGSAEWSVKEPQSKGHDPVDIKAVNVSPDGKTVFLELAEVVPVMQMRIKYDLKAADGTAVKNNIFTTINVVPEERVASQR
jgi:hypothetical protein